MIVWRHMLGTTLREGTCVLALGNFDGVHLGHKAVIDRAQLRAKTLGVPLVVVTFDPHPTAIVAHRCKSKLLMTLSQRLDAFCAMGVDLVWVIPFDNDVAKLAPLAFLSELHRALTPVELYVGCGFRFGNGRHGSLDVLERWGREVGCKFFSHVLEHYGSDSISSTRIRKALDSGDVELASALLGRPYVLTGDITFSRNTRCFGGCSVFDLLWEQEQSLQEGVYVTEVSGISLSDRLLGVTDISNKSHLCGTHSTDITVTTSLLGFAGQMFGHRAELHFLHRLRGLHKFVDDNEARMQSVQDAVLATNWYLKYKKQANICR